MNILMAFFVLLAAADSNRHVCVALLVLILLGGAIGVLSAAFVFNG